MKIRTDFVTNSSSSSFIVGFTSESNIGRELLDCPDVYYKMLFRDVMEAEMLTAEDVEAKSREELRWECEYELEQIMHRKGMNWDEAWKYSFSDEAKPEIEKMLDNKVAKIKREMNGKNVFVEVEYSDHDSSEMEHEIMPYLNATVARFSHH